MRLINSISDLHNRTLVESNTLKSFILSQSDTNREPSRDDILIHDYQIANSITINSILSNFIVNMNMAISGIEGESSFMGDSYFQIVNSVSEAESLDETVRMFLQMDDDLMNGSFYSKTIVPTVSDVVCDAGTVKFVNLDTMWYSIVLNQVMHNLELQGGVHQPFNAPGDEGIQYEMGYADKNRTIIDDSWEYTIAYDELKLAGEDMNDPATCRNPFEIDNEPVNPFESPMRYYKNGVEGEYVEYDSFNAFNKKYAIENMTRVYVNCIVENKFFGNFTQSSGTSKDGDFIGILSSCRYIVCMSNGWYGIQWVKSPDYTVGGFTGIKLYNLGEIIPSIRTDDGKAVDDLYEFTNCQFKCVDDNITFFVIFKERKEFENGKHKYHYIYFNDDSYDELYGMIEMRELVTNQLVVEPGSVFNHIEYLKELESVTVGMTDYGFWDIEPNETNSIVYSYRRTKDYKVIEEINNREDKIVRPDLLLQDDDTVIVEYDTTWDLKSSDNRYYGTVWTRNEDGTYSGELVTHTFDEVSQVVSYAKTVKNGRFVGATDSFAIYNAFDSNPACLLVLLQYSQFVNLLFSQPELTSVFIKWLYDQVTHSEKGEYYLMTNHGRFVTDLNYALNNIYNRFVSQSYSLEDTELIDAKGTFVSVKTLVQSKYNEATGLYDYCDTLNKIVNKGLFDMNSILDVNELKKLIDADFKDGYHANKRTKLVDDIVDGVLIEKYPLLSYFRQYLVDHLNNDLEDITTSNIQLMADVINGIVKNVIEFIRNKVQTALVLGGYDVGKVGNECYPKFNSYIYWNRVGLKKSNISQIMSSSNILDVVTKSIKDAPFFSNYSTYIDIYDVFNDTSKEEEQKNLFKVSKDVDFVRISGLLDDESKVKVSWNDLKDWLFKGNSHNELTMLKAFLRTQFYRALFFNASDYSTFTRDSKAYKCFTTKYYENHDGIIKELVFEKKPKTDEPDYENVDEDKSGMTGSVKNGQIKDVEYSIITNRLVYNIIYDPINIIDDKFVYNDIEFYVTRKNDTRKISRLYFNEFQKALSFNSDKITISYDQADGFGRFKLGEVDYVIENDKYLRMELKPASGEKEEYPFAGGQYRQEIIDDRFTINGIKYYLLKNEGGRYGYVVFGEVEDKKLNTLLVSMDGSCNYDTWGLTFLFDSENDTVVIKYIYNTLVIDRILREWCSFDDRDDIEIDGKSGYEKATTTFNHYLAVELARLESKYPSYSKMIYNLHDTLYSGALEVSPTNNRICDITISNYVSGGDVFSKCIALIGKDVDNLTTNDYGIILDANLSIPMNKVILGAMGDNNVVDTTKSGWHYIVKDTNYGPSVINTIGIPNETWSTGFVTNRDVGTYTIDEESNEIYVTFNQTEEDTPDYLKIIPVFESDGVTISKYQVSSSTVGDDTFIVNKKENSIHFIVPVYSTGHVFLRNDRYRIDLLNGHIYRVVVGFTGASTLDFSTQYVFSVLRNNLFINIRQNMLNGIVQSIVNNGDVESIGFPMDSKYNTYVDMFTDSASVSNYRLASECDTTSLEYLKYAEIFKNHLNEVDSSDIVYGKLYSYLDSLISNTFTSGSIISNQIELVDAPSIQAYRVDKIDKFKYDVYGDLYIRASKRLLDKKMKNNPYVIGDAVIKGINFRLTFVPKFNYGNEMTYDVTYEVIGQTNAIAYYDQIIYVYNKSIKTKFLNPIYTNVDVKSTSTSQANKTIETDITTESVIDLIQNDATLFFNDEDIVDLFVAINNKVNGQKEIARIQEKNIKDSSQGKWKFLLNSSETKFIDSDIEWEGLNPIEISRGKVYVYGQLYNIIKNPSVVPGGGKDDIFKYNVEYLQQADGSNKYWLKLLNRATPVVDSEGKSSISYTNYICMVHEKPLYSRDEILKTYSLHSLIGKNEEQNDYEIYSMFTSDGGGDPFPPKWVKVGGTPQILNINKDNIIVKDLTDSKEDMDDLKSFLPDGGENYWLVDSYDDPTIAVIGKDLDGIDEKFQLKITKEEYDSIKAGTTLDKVVDMDGIVFLEEESSEPKEETEKEKLERHLSSTSKRISMPGKIGMKLSYDTESNQLVVELNEPTTKSCRIFDTFIPSITKKSDLTNMDDQHRADYTTIYAPFDIQSVETEEIQETEEGEESVDIVQITFLVGVVKSRQIVDSIPRNTNEEYLQFNMLVGNDNIVTAYSMLDFQHERAYKSYNYGFVRYYTNLEDIRKKLADETIPAEEKPTIDDLEYINVLVYFNPSSDNTLVMKEGTDGYYSPYSLDILPGNADNLGQEGYVYDRFYLTESIIYSTPKKLDTEEASEKVWIDKSTLVKSIKTTPTNYTYKKLIYNADGTENTNVPESMRSNVKTHVNELLSLPKEYFEYTLSQFKSFLLNIDKELKYTFTNDDRANIANLCKFTYDIDVAYTNMHINDNSKWNDIDKGLFGYDRDGNTYKGNLNSFNEHLYSGFYIDHAKPTDCKEYSPIKDYGLILLDEFSTLSAINDKKNNTLGQLYANIGNTTHNIIDDIFGEIYADTVRYINLLKTSIKNDIVGVYVFDGYCNVFSKSSIDGALNWNVFESSQYFINRLVDNLVANHCDWTFEIPSRYLDFKIVEHPVSHLGTHANWFFRFANRDFGKNDRISDAFVLRCLQTQDEKQYDLWYLSSIGKYIYCQKAEYELVDIAYEEVSNSVYAIFSDDNYIYRYDNVEDRKDSKNRVLLVKEYADMKIATFNSSMITDVNHKIGKMYIDYSDVLGAEVGWEFSIWGRFGNKTDIETWYGSPSSKSIDFSQFNTLIFGDSLFDENQLKFQNISKNKEMFDLLDIDEVDGCYYGLFKNDEIDDDQIYTIFKVNPTGGVVERLPYQVVYPSIYRANDQLYSLYALIREDGLDDDGNTVKKLKLREISVPDSDLYSNRTIELEDILLNEFNQTNDELTYGDLQVQELIMSRFRPMTLKYPLFVLSNLGFHKIGYKNQFNQLSIDTLDDFKEALKESLTNTIINTHIVDKHSNEDYFIQMGRKINQFEDGFTAFKLIPTEFKYTQDVGVTPNGIIDDTDESTDHRVDSVTASTDILVTDGMTLGYDTNPGFITGAVSNPATLYDDDTVFIKSQRNPSLEGTEFYDYIYDQDGNTLMDLYSIPFVYRVNSNNTYDLYINVPTTRTKYLNRVAGTLNPDHTSQVLPDDSRNRRNISNESLSNNLDDSTTKLRIYIDKKFISIGNVELVEICGNSIPLGIYRDSTNDGFYDSLALESRWNGDVVDESEPSKDINKVMLEFECYGTDSQSIHITGKTLVNPYLDDNKYIFG